jgi:ABC-type phosphate transport system substrate-binding protein
MTSRIAHRRALLPACVLSAAASVAMAAPGVASASLGEQCSGSSITAQGASVEKIAQDSVWGPAFNSSNDKLACSGKYGTKAKPTITYTSTGSGAGLKSWGAELKEGEKPEYGVTNAFIGTSEAPDATQISEIESNETTSTPKTLETIPVVQLAIAVIVNLPSGCTATSTAAPGRLVLNNSTLEGIFQGTINTWSQIKDDGDALSGESCNTSTPITRVAREDQAGTTHILKRYLNLIDSESFPLEGGGTGSWNAISEGALNTTWPQGSVAVVKPKSKGDAEEAAKVAATPGSIGYGNLAEIRSTSDFSGSGGGPTTARFWVELQHSSKKGKVTYSDPSTNGDVAEVGNANCNKTAYTNGSSSFPPPAITAPWNEVTTETTEKEYTLCGFSYVLAFTSYSAYPGTTQVEATTVNNYLRFVVDKKGGQAAIANHDYLALPKGTVLNEAVAGAAAIGF